MKNLNSVVIISTFFLIIMTVGCGKKSLEPSIFDDSKLRIKSLSFKGIPNSQIQIDQDKLLIKVKVPSLLMENLDPSIELSENARIREGFEELIDEVYSGVGFFIQDSVPISLVYKDDPQQYPTPVTMYRFILSPSGSLELAPLNKVLNHELFTPNVTSVYIPFINLYGNVLPTSAKLINNTTGRIYKADDAIFKGYGQYVNSLGINLDRVADLVLGDYILEVTSKNGDNYRVSQPLIIKAGPVAIRYPRTYFGYDVLSGKTLDLEGNNLFKGYFSVSLVDKNGKVFFLPDLEFNDTGTLVRAKLPSDLAVGQYVLRSFQNGSQTNLCYRVNVIEPSKKRVYIGTIGSDYAPCSLGDAIIAYRDKKIFFTYFSDYSGTPRLKMISQDATVTDYGVVTSYSNPTSPVPPDVTFSQEMTPGYYKAILEIMNDGGKVIAESLPFARLIKIE